MKKLFILLCFTFFLNSCSDYNECTESLAGIYDAQILGVSGQFVLAVSIDKNDDIYIDSEWYDGIWTVIEADTDGCADYNNDAYGEVEIDIKSQEIADDIEISGSGFYYDYSMQIDYKIKDNGNIKKYTLVASKR
ncbi:MAG: hypothetical protein R2771_13000 [Saprospiraceae bacterium]